MGVTPSRGLSERQDPDLARFGKRLMTELALLIQGGRESPALGEWRVFNARFARLAPENRDREDEAGVFARRLVNERESLWLCISEDGVDPTNNRAERALRYGVIWRKRSLGTWSEKGDRWVERILSLKHTCRMHGIPAYSRLVQAVADYLGNQPTDLAWIGTLA